MPVWNPDLPDPIDYQAQWTDVPDNEVFDNGFKAQWELFLTAAAQGEPFRWDLAEGAKGVQLAELALQSSAEGRRLAVPRWRSDVGASITLPGRPCRSRSPSRAGSRCIRRRSRAASTRPPTSPRPGRQHRLGRHPGVPRAPVARTGSASPRRWTPPSAAWACATTRRCELIARSAARAAELGAAIVSGAGHRPAAAWPALAGRDHRRLRRTARARAGLRQRGHRDGEPRAGRQRRVRRATTSRSTTRC